MRENQKKQLKVDMYNNIMNTQNVSDIFAKKKYLEWNDKDILADREFRRKDAEFQWELQQIAAMGPGWKAQILAQGAAMEGGGGEPPMGGGGASLGGGGGVEPPPFGGGPAVEAGGGETPEPFGGEANTTPPPGEGQPPA